MRLTEWRAKKHSERMDKKFKKDLSAFVKYARRLDAKRFNGMYDGDYDVDEEPIRKEEPND